MRQALGDGYAEALRKTYKEVPESTEYVMYWWHKAAELTRKGKARRFGFITTNSLPQTFNRKVVQHHLGAKPPLSMVFAIPDHPWVDSADGAAVRIAMTVGQGGELPGTLQRVTGERSAGGEGLAVDLQTRTGKLFADLTIGANVAGAEQLRANADLCAMGVKLHGEGFQVAQEETTSLGLGRIPGLEKYIKHFRNGRDLAQRPRGLMVIDLFGLQPEEVRSRFPEVFQWVLERVKPERDQNNRASYREKWWIFGEPRKDLRPALEGLDRYIATVRTAKHRIFQFVPSDIIAESKIVVVASDVGELLGILSSKNTRVLGFGCWGVVGCRKRSNSTITRIVSIKFPFPNATEDQKARVRRLAEALDAHRKRQQEQFPDLTMTGMYNVLGKLRAGEELTDKEKQVHEHGLVAVLRQLHDELDAAVAEAYGWPADLSDEAILERLVDLNRERVKEEEQGVVRWLRPEYQCPSGTLGGKQGELLETERLVAPALAREKPVWPKTLPEQVAAVRAALAQQTGPVSAKELKEHFKHAREPKVLEILAALASIGQAREVGPGRFTS